MKQVGFYVTKNGKPDDSAEGPFSKQDITSADAEAGFASTPMFIFAAMPLFYRPTPHVQIALRRWRKMKADFEAFDGDKRGISHALSEMEFAVLKAIADDHLPYDGSDHNAFVTSPLVALLDHLVKP